MNIKKHDRVLCSYGHDKHSATVREVSADGLYMRVAFWPWPIFGIWVEIKSHYSSHATPRLRNIFMRLLGGD